MSATAKLVLSAIILAVVVYYFPALTPIAVLVILLMLMYGVGR